METTDTGKCTRGMMEDEDLPDTDTLRVSGGTVSVLVDIAICIECYLHI